MGGAVQVELGIERRACGWGQIEPYRQALIRAGGLTLQVQIALQGAAAAGAGQVQLQLLDLQLLRQQGEAAQQLVQAGGRGTGFCCINRRLQLQVQLVDLQLLCIRRVQAQAGPGQVQSLQVQLAVALRQAQCPQIDAPGGQTQPLKLLHVDAVLLQLALHAEVAIAAQRQGTQQHKDKGQPTPSADHGHGSWVSCWQLTAWAAPLPVSYMDGLCIYIIRCYFCRK